MLDMTSPIVHQHCVRECNFPVQSPHEEEESEDNNLNMHKTYIDKYGLSQTRPDCMVTSCVTAQKYFLLFPNFVSNIIVIVI